MSGIQGITFDNQVVTAKDHGQLFECLLSDGVISGCSLSKTAASITVGKGYLLIAGRLIKLTSAQTIATPLPSAAGFYRIIATVNLAGTATETVFTQVSFSAEFATAVAGFRSLTHGAVNDTGSLYEYELCTYRALTSGLYSVYKATEQAHVELADGTLLTAEQGGTGRSSLTAHYLLIGNGSNAITLLSPGSSGYILMSNGSSADPSFKAQSNITKVGTLTEGEWKGTAIGIAYGGTGTTNGASGLKNLLAAGATVLSAYQYGSTLPSAGTAGRLFFKTVG